MIPGSKLYHSIHTVEWIRDFTEKQKNEIYLLSTQFDTLSNNIFPLDILTVKVDYISTIFCTEFIVL